MESNQTVLRLRFIVGLLITPLMWVAALYLGATDSLLSGAQSYVYLAGFLWLLSVSGIAKGLAWVFKTYLSFGLLAVTALGLSIFAGWALGADTFMVFPVIGLSTALVFALIAGLRWRIK